MRTFILVGPPIGKKTVAAQESPPVVLKGAGPPRRLAEGYGVFVGIGNVLLLQLLAILAIWYGATAARQMAAAPPASLVAAAFSPG